MQQKRILVVEDEGLIANDIADQLQRGGYAVSAIASSGEEALASLEHTRPDLILMDIRLKGKMDGIDTAIRVRSEHRLPVIFLTSHADAETLSRARLAAPFGYLVKPFRQLNLCSAIEVALYKHQSDRALLEREAWLSTILQSAADATVVTDVEGRIQFISISAGQLLDHTGETLIGQRWTEVFRLVPDPAVIPSHDPAALPHDPVAAAIRTREVQRISRGISLRKRSGETVAVEAEVAPSILDGEVAGAVVTIRDISARQREEAELRHEQKTRAIGRLAGGVAHDFNNLLTVMIGHGSLLAAKLSRPEELAHIDSVLEAAHTASELTRQLLTLSGRLVLKTELVAVDDASRRMVRLLLPTLGSNVQIEMDLEAAGESVRMNAAQLDQVLLNLILNARDAMHSGGTIRVSTAVVERTLTGTAQGLDPASRNGAKEIRSAFVRIAVADTGSGIPAEVREHLFEPFFTTKPAGEGTGLGLATVQGIVRDASGEITVASALKIGSCFEVFLPCAEERKPAATEPVPVEIPPEGSASPGGAVKTILLAEDDAGIRDLVDKYLKHQGFTILQAPDGEKALALAATYEGSIDLLISDVLMPNMDGPTLSQQLARTRPRLRTLLVSGHPGDVMDSLRRVGLDWAFLQKPFTLRGLLDKVQELIGDQSTSAAGRRG